MQPTVQKFAKVIFLTILIPTLVIIALSLLRQYRRWRLGVLRADDEEALRRLGEYRVVKQTWHGWKATTPEGVDLKIPKRQSRTQVRTFSRPGRKISGWQKAVYPQSTSRANGDENENEEELRRQMRRSSTARRASGAMPRLPSVAYSRPGRPDRLGRSRHPSGRAAPLASTRTTEVTGSSGSEVMHPSTRKCNKDAYDHSQWEFNRVVDLKLNRIWKYFHPEIHDFPNKDAMMPPAWQPGDPEGSDDDDVSTAYTTVVSVANLMMSVIILTTSQYRYPAWDPVRSRRRVRLAIRITTNTSMNLVWNLSVNKGANPANTTNVTLTQRHLDQGPNVSVIQG